MTQWITIAEYAERWRRPYDTVKGWAERGRLPYIRVGKLRILVDAGAPNPERINKRRNPKMKKKNTEKKIVKVTRANIYIRQKPSPYGKAAYKPAKGTTFPLIEKSADGNWYKIRLIEGSSKAYPNIGWFPVSCSTVLLDIPEPGKKEEAFVPTGWIAAFYDDIRKAGYTEPQAVEIAKLAIKHSKKEKAGCACGGKEKCKD